MKARVPLVSSAVDGILHERRDFVMHNLILLIPDYGTKIKNPLNKNLLRGFFEVPGGFEPPYTVLQTAD